jgi:penicillin amidase
MVTAAKKSLAVIEKDSTTKTMLDAYTAGVNAYINSLEYPDFPLEYKLLDYEPEQWTNLKSALLIKYMGDDLTGNVDDLENTNALQYFSLDQFNQIYPDFPDSLYPIIPKGELFYNPGKNLPPPPPDSLWLKSLAKVNFKPKRPDKSLGSNNWAVSGKKTENGFPILCNDPHLGLNLPSLWFEVQLHTPQMNVYGASLPGAPGVVIGFNSNIAWGLTNSMRDVKDFYTVRFKDASKQQYWFNNSWKNAEIKVEEIKIRNRDSFYDTVAYTVWGPVMYDPSFPDTVAHRSSLAILWIANDSTNELLTFNLLNHAKNYDDYKNALKYFDCPPQTFVYADISGNIGIWQQGKFPLRWKNQGKFILPGDDSTFAWKGYIPYMENPHILDPEQNYVFSANQNPTDSTYPYPYFGNFIHYRAERISKVLAKGNNFTMRDMMNLQTSYYDEFAAQTLPFMLKYMDTTHLNAMQQQFMDNLKQWHYKMIPESPAPTVFYTWWKDLYSAIWKDDIQRSKQLPLPNPTDNTTIEWLLRDPDMPYIDNRNTPQKESLGMLINGSFSQCVDSLSKADSTEQLFWGNYRGTNIMHLTGIEAFSRMNLFTGGSKYTVNANKKDDETGNDIGPSWRMVVQMSNPVKAYGIYPGGQSGNPGSRYYDNFIKDWVDGKYYLLNFFTLTDSVSPKVRYRIVFNPKLK